MFLELRIDPDQGLNSNPPRSDKSATRMLSDSVPFSLSTASLASFLSIVHNASDLIAYFFTVSLVLAPHPTWKWLLKMTSYGLNWTKTNLHQHPSIILNMHGQSINLLAKRIDNKSKSWKQQWRFFTFRMRMMWMWIFWSHAWFRASVEWAKIFLRVARLRWKIK